MKKINGQCRQVFPQLENLTMSSHHSGRSHYNSWVGRGSRQTAVTEHSQLRLDEQLWEEGVCNPQKSHCQLPKCVQIAACLASYWKGFVLLSSSVLIWVKAMWEKSKRESWWLPQYSVLGKRPTIQHFKQWFEHINNTLTIFSDVPKLNVRANIIETIHWNIKLS